jgi:excisionase family DNA binding protein
MTVAEAAELLEITKEAVRKRISRGSLRSDKDPDGTVWVYVPVSPTASGTASGSFDRDELVAELRARIEDLRTDRDAWRDQARRSDYLASTAMDRTRELEGRLRELEAGPPPAGPEEPRESDVSPGPTRTPYDAGDGQQTSAQRRPWWRRMFGG